MNYESFVATKLVNVPPTGISDPDLRRYELFDFQRALTTWALRRGRAAIFADTGLGKSRMQLSWASEVACHTGKQVLVLAPLAVGAQTEQEAKAIGVDAVHVREPNHDHAVVITNYERLHHFDASAFGGVVLDESSIIKHHDSKTLGILMDAFARTPFRLCCTATPAPNDFMELGTHAEFLGICTRAEMLSEFFVHDGGETQKWRLKGHARGAFWRFVASWGALLRSPADIGFDGSAYELPPIRVEHHIIESGADIIKESGLLFAQAAQSLMERRSARKGSIAARVRACAELVGCRGSLSTPKTGGVAPNSTQNTEREETLKGAGTETKSSHTCATTTEQTNRSGSEAGISKKPSISDSVNATRQTLNTEKSASASRKSTRIHSPESDSDSKSSGSLQTSTTQCCSHKEAGVPFAGAHPTSAGEVGSTLITATPRDECAESCVHRAILASESLRTIPTECSEQWIIWCELNAEQEALVKILGNECVSIYGALDADEKIERYQRWLRGESRILVTKPSIFGFGCNMQHCARMAFVGVTDSWESYYQAVRRIYRFGQKRECQVHVFASELEGNVVANLQRKERDAAAMAEALSAETSAMVRESVTGSTRETNEYTARTKMIVPAWCTSDEEAA